MSRVELLLISLMGTLAVCTDAAAITTTTEPADHPYQGIVERNIFGLKPPPPPPNPADIPKPPAAKITLTGITTFGSKRAIMKVTPVTAPKPAKPGEPPKGDVTLMLAVGQAEEDVEVLAIDEIAGEVKVKNSGDVQTLNFKDNGVKPASAPAPPVAGVPGVPPPVMPVGLPKPANHPTPGGFSGMNGGFPPRTPRTQTGPQTGAPGLDTQPAAGGIAAPANFQNGSVQALPGGISQQDLDAVNARTPEENVLIYEASRLRNQQISQQTGMRIPDLGPHPYARGLTAPAGQQAPQ